MGRYNRGLSNLRPCNDPFKRPRELEKRRIGRKVSSRPWHKAGIIISGRPRRSDDVTFTSTHYKLPGGGGSGVRPNAAAVIRTAGHDLLVVVDVVVVLLVLLLVIVLVLVVVVVVALDVLVVDHVLGFEESLQRLAVGRVVASVCRGDAARLAQGHAHRHRLNRLPRLGLNHLRQLLLDLQHRRTVNVAAPRGQFSSAPGCRVCANVPRSRGASRV
jgi:hypothetical protein